MAKSEGKNMNSKRVILAGGSGFLGKLLSKYLTEQGYDVIVLTRHPNQSAGAVKEIHWDGRTLGPWAEHLNGARAVVNLAGKSVNCRYTPDNRREINESRVNSVRVIGEAIRASPNPPPVLVQAASLAIYGDAGDRWCDENTSPGSGFPVETCLLWEKAFEESPTPQTRRVILRIGFVLGKSGGALQTLARLAKLGLGGTVGNGRQFISWIHCLDMNRLFTYAIEQVQMSGAFNATGPQPVTNAEFMRELRRAVHRPWSPPAPSWAVHIGSRLMGTEASLALTGRRCAPKRLQENGFNFKFSAVREALAEIYG
jgi:uncharacterized protein (TIGR01777 family)